MKYTTQQLIQERNSGIQHKFLFFWGHAQKNDNEIDKSCFSQWFLSPFSVEGVIYPTAEHWMMARKALLFNDKEIYEKILQSEKPGSAKALGRKVRNFEEDVWESNAFGIVKIGNYHKFTQHQSLKKFLLHTGDTVIVEASPFDFVWGIGLAQSSNLVYDPAKWRGKNLLGFALMEVRDSLKQSI